MSQRQPLLTITFALLFVACYFAPSLAADGAELKSAPHEKQRATERDARAKAYGHLMRSTVAARKGDYRKAADEIQSARKLQPDSASIHAQAAEMLLFIGRADQAEQAAKRAHEIEPEEPQSLRFLAQMATERARIGDINDDEAHREALELLEELDRLGHGDTEVLSALSAVRMRLGDQAGALAAAAKLVDQTPGNKQAVSRLIGLQLEAKLDREALETALNFVSKHPNDQDLLGFAQELADRSGGWDAIEKRFSAEPGLDSSNTLLQRLWGIARLEIDQPERALLSFERALAAMPDDQSLRFEIARMYRGQGRLADAAALLHEVTAATPSDRRALLMLGETLAEQGVVDGALNAFVAALRLFSTVGDETSLPVRDAIRQRMILLYLGNDQHEPALELFDSVEDTKSAQTAELRARLAIASEDWESARAILQNVRETAGDGTASLLEGEILARTGRWGKVGAAFDAAIKQLGPASAARIAEIHLEGDRASDGEVYLKEWVEAEPENPDAWFLYASFVTRSDSVVRAEPMLRRVLKLQPDHATALNFLGYSFADEGIRLEEALEMIQRAVELDPWNGAFLDSLGWVYFQMGRYDEARAPLESAAREFPADAVILEHLGDLYRELGESDLARSAWSQALDQDPEDPSKLEAKIAHLSSSDREQPNQSQ